jgi:hypothetical protein
MRLINTQNLGSDLPLSRYVRQRREDLGLTIARASELAGMAFSEWCALECGWIPRDRATLHAIRATLTTGFYDFYAIVQMSQFTRPIGPQPSLQEVQ